MKIIVDGCSDSALSARDFLCCNDFCNVPLPDNLLLQIGLDFEIKMKNTSSWKPHQQPKRFQYDFPYR